MKVSMVADEASGVTLRRLVQGWQGEYPHAWWPSSSTFVDLLRAETGDAGRGGAPLVAGAPVPVTSSPTVIAMPRRMAEVLGWPSQESPSGPGGIGWSDIIRLAADGRGWGAFGHPEWGAFKLGKTNPELSPSGLSATIATIAATMPDGPEYSRRALARPEVRGTVHDVERSVVHYATSSAPFLGNLWQADRRGDALGYVSALWLDEQAVYQYNQRRPRDPLVAVYPREGVVAADHPLVPLRSAAMDAVHRAAFADFAAFLTKEEGRALLRARGYRDAQGGFDSGRLNERNGVLPEARVRVLPSPGPDGVRLVLDAWRELRKPANLLLLVDGSGSMAAPAFRGRSLTRLDAAKIAIRKALNRLDQDDAVGLWAITSAAGGSHERLAPVRHLGPPGGDRRGDVVDRVNTLRSRGNTPLYAAVRDAYETVRETARDDSINAVLVLSDGENSGSGGPSLDELTRRLGDLYGRDRATGRQVRVFAVRYRRADQPAAAPSPLTRMAEATGGVFADAAPGDIDSVLDQLISDF